MVRGIIPARLPFLTQRPDDSNSDEGETDSLRAGPSNYRPGHRTPFPRPHNTGEDLPDAASSDDPMPTIEAGAYEDSDEEMEDAPNVQIPEDIDNEGEPEIDVDSNAGNSDDDLDDSDRHFQEDYDEANVQTENQSQIQSPLPKSPSSEPWHAPKDGTYVCLNDPSEEVPHTPQDFDMSEGMLGMCMFINKYSVGRRQWTDLVDVLRLFPGLPPELAALPKRVDTMKKRFKSQLPLVKMRRQSLQLDQSKIPSRASSTEDIVMFDMRDVFCTMLQSSRLMARTYTGMAQIVDNPTEFWQSNSWGCSIRTTSGQFARYPGKDNSPVFPSDFLWYLDENASSSDNVTLGRVHFVG